MQKKTIASGLDRLIISIDGTTQEVYQQYRIGGKLDKVIEGCPQYCEVEKRNEKQQTLCGISIPCG
jgi:molybdenum cofactor biosynthesis enzyme MoaA